MSDHPKQTNERINLLSDEQRVELRRRRERKEELAKKRKTHPLSDDEKKELKSHQNRISFLLKSTDPSWTKARNKRKRELYQENNYQEKNPFACPRNARDDYSKHGKILDAQINTKAHPSQPAYHQQTLPVQCMEHQLQATCERSTSNKRPFQERYLVEYNRQLLDPSEHQNNIVQPLTANYQYIRSPEPKRRKISEALDPRPSPFRNDTLAFDHGTAWNLHLISKEDSDDCHYLRVVRNRMHHIPEKMLDHTGCTKHIAEGQVDHDGYLLRDFDHDEYFQTVKATCYCNRLVKLVKRISPSTMIVDTRITQQRVAELEESSLSDYKINMDIAAEKVAELDGSKHELEMQNKILKKKNNSLESEINALKSKINMDIAAEKVAELDGSKHELQMQNKILKSKNNSLKSEINALKSKINTLERRITPSKDSKSKTTAP